jgi:hypothetical protein
MIRHIGSVKIPFSYGSIISARSMTRELDASMHVIEQLTKPCSMIVSRARCRRLTQAALV